MNDIHSALEHKLPVCWNDALRKIFKCNRWECVKIVQYCISVVS